MPSPDDEFLLPLWIVPALFYMVGFVFVIKLFRFLEYGYAYLFDVPLYRNLLVYKRLKKEQHDMLRNHFPFYRNLSNRNKRLFQHRMVNFIKNKDFISKEGASVTDYIKLMVAAHATMLAFGRKHHDYVLVDSIEVFPDSFYNDYTDRYLDGAFFPTKRTLAVSWNAIEKPTGNHRNLLIHEFMHALQWESRLTRNFDSERYNKYYKKIIHRLSEPEVKEKINSGFLRSYALTNEFEFMAELAEYYFENPDELQSNFPVITGYMEKILNVPMVRE